MKNTEDKVLWQNQFTLQFSSKLYKNDDSKEFTTIAIKAKKKKADAIPDPEFINSVDKRLNGYLHIDLWN